VVSHALQQTGLPASSLILEITEDAIVNNIPLAREVLGKIKKLGVAIALDDFGTGYSSLSLLRDLPIDTLKIDKSFIRALGQNSHDLMITQAIIGLGENLNLAIIAEGVETKQQMQILHDHHCHLQQGYYFSRPIPYPALIKWIHNPTYTHL
jgi:EAL domain-containing protein (putative c-di-GMP-specific phosphodiesterase class I)